MLRRIQKQDTNDIKIEKHYKKKVNRPTPRVIIIILWVIPYENITSHHFKMSLIINENKLIECTNKFKRVSLFPLKKYVSKTKNLRLLISSISFNQNASTTHLLNMTKVCLSRIKSISYNRYNTLNEHTLKLTL
jgi:hypothetical protein